MSDVFVAVLRDESEKIVGEDKDKLPVVDCPQFKKSGGVRWFTCEECGATNCLQDASGTYYHKLSCSKSNGIGYESNNERGLNGSHNKLKCPCSVCKGAKGG